MLMFSNDDQAAAREVGVTVAQWQAWKYGDEPVPKVVWLYLKLKRELERMGSWRGFQIDGERLISPWGDGMRFEEWFQLKEYRRASKLAEQQAELIEQLMKERDFYRENCHRQARFGLKEKTLEQSLPLLRILHRKYLLES
ncbi:hypothetical protein [Chromobacterium sp. IIBBL 290-4]|uniref:hypothetical protein n=1 Tax=Chromobacterium sp. IIBBL 290-4 TaxID=2953890 RepID=UPI0020B8D7A0|nr:hypothetical protein [Chromobacterium sp. IIBBL 290-4]UTH73591.1 hypothetical protein NKT35_18920 [Chromobacterium sp. IIBBL 290-4]